MFLCVTEIIGYFLLAASCAAVSPADLPSSRSNESNLISREPLSDLLETFQHQTHNAMVILDDDCILGVLREEVQQCEELGAQPDWCRSAIAIRMTACIFHQSRTTKALPPECGEPELGSKATVEQCVDVLSTDSVWWTTYFGYFNIAANVCEYYSRPLEADRMLSVYQSFVSNISTINKIMKQLQDADLLDTMRSSVERQVNSLVKEIVTDAETQVAHYRASLELNLQELSKSVEVTSNRVSQLQNETLQGAIAVEQEVTRSGERALEALNVTVESGLRGISRQTSQTTKQLRRGIQQENKLLLQDLGTQNAHYLEAYARYQDEIRAQLYQLRNATLLTRDDINDWQAALFLSASDAAAQVAIEVAKAEHRESNRAHPPGLLNLFGFNVQEGVHGSRLIMGFAFGVWWLIMRLGLLSVLVWISYRVFEISERLTLRNALTLGGVCLGILVAAVTSGL